MERKIGEIFEYNGEWYQCVESDNCDRCSLSTTECGSGTKSYLAFEVFGNCSKSRRSDNKHAIFKKLEKAGEPYPNDDKLYQLYKLPMNIEKLPPHTEGINLVRFDIVEIEIKQNKEDMETNEGKTGLDFVVAPPRLAGDKPEHQLNLKPFNLEAAKAGKPVCTRDGRKARIICFDSNGGRPIVALVTECDDEEEIPYKYHCDGFYNCQSIPSDNDLMMLPEKKEGWVNIVRGNDGKSHMGRGIFQSKEESENAIKTFGDNLIDTVKIQWEE